MRILACETSTLLGSVALFDGNTLLAETSQMRQGSHSDAINDMIQQVLHSKNLELRDIDVFATGLGPGSFTGIRISFNTAKTFSYIHNKPLAGIDSLKNLAYLNKHLLNQKNPHICCAINAFKNMVYIATYKLTETSLIETRPPQVKRVQELAEFLTDPILLVGDAFLTYENYMQKNLSSKIIRHEKIQDYPNATALGQLVSLEKKFFHWSEALPLYLRASEAEENINGIKYQPL